MGRKKEAEKEHARLLFVNERLTFEQIAERVNPPVSPRTVSRWALEGDWEAMRKSLLTTRQSVLTMLYNQLEAITIEIAKRDNPVPISKEADTITKITSSIQRLEVETSLGEYIETGRKVLTFIQGVDLEHAKLFNSYFDEFISSELKRK